MFPGVNFLNIPDMVTCAGPPTFEAIHPLPLCTANVGYRGNALGIVVIGEGCGDAVTSFG